MKITVLALLVRIFGLIESWAGRMRALCSYCPNCGRNRYTGAPCTGGPIR